MPFHGPNADRVSIHLGREIKNSAPMVQPMNKLTPRLPPPLAFFCQPCFEQLVLDKNSTDPRTGERTRKDHRSGSLPLLPPPRSRPTFVGARITINPGNERADRFKINYSIYIERYNTTGTARMDRRVYVRVARCFTPNLPFSFSLSPSSPLSLLRSVRNISGEERQNEERRTGALFLLVLVRQPLRPVALPAYKVGIARVRPCSFIGVR